ncbi:CHASE3 domain-containing protein [Hydrogenophaga sp.]|uniref:CHASE3 domain-containing protein n=1 Tax=Hydrogenophaga sp. TaxID=1904254 RepID=UPI0025C278E4|nr:CHASE3 domain-containing protein [Hydrogenophaga sp.]
MNVIKGLRHSRIVLTLAVAAAVGMVVLSEGAYWQSARALNDLAAIGDARSDILRLQQSVLAAEAGQRGYLLTARREYLAPYDQALRDIDESFSRLDRYYASSATSVERLDNLRALTDTKLTELAVAIRLYDEGKSAASTDIVLSALNKQQMEAIRALGTELLDSQALQADAGRETLDRTLKGRRIGMALLTAISLLALYLFLRRTDELKQQQKRLKDLVQAERDRLEIEVAQRTEQLTKLARHLQTAREDERNRLARNLHDELGSLLTSAKLDAARIKSRLAGTSPEALERLAHLVQTLNQSIALGRSIIEDLRPSTLGNLGLVPTLEILTREFADQTGIAVDCALSPVKLSANAELMVYRLVQEAITNISKYARARRVWVNMLARNGQVEVSVCDDGVGFDTSAPAKSTFGLLGMRFRVEAEGGKLTLVSSPGRGTQIVVTLPESRTTSPA